MLTPLIVYIILDISGQHLIAAYPNQMLTLLRHLLSTSVPQYKSFFDSKDFLRERYNSDQVLPELPQNDKDREKLSGATIAQR
jgi:hypothetical protein